MFQRKSTLIAAAACFALLATGFAGAPEHSEGFEGPTPWFAGPGAGFDHNRGLARTGTGNAWVRNGPGWSAVNYWFDPSGVPVGRICEAQAWIRLGPTVTDAYFSIREKGSGGAPSGPVVKGLRLRGSPPAYRLYRFAFPRTAGPMLLYIGNWGHDRDPWLQADDVEISCGRYII